MSKSEFTLLSDQNRIKHIDPKTNTFNSKEKETGAYTDLPEDEKEEFYRKARKLFRRFIESEISVFSKKNSIFDLLIHSEEELALLQNWRIQKYNDKLNTSKKFYKNIMKNK